MVGDGRTAADTVLLALVDLNRTSGRFLFLGRHISEVKCTLQLHFSCSFKLFCLDLKLQ